MATIDLSRLNDSQRAVATRLDEPLFVAAGAGSGKTFTLTARLVHALSKGSAEDGGRFLDSIDQALVITFTKAAALEIAERVRGALRAAGTEDPFLREESFKVDGAWISTIHGMCARILRRHAVELGIDPEFRVCEGSVAESLMATAADEVLGEVQRDADYAALLAEYDLNGDNGVSGMVAQLRAEAAKCLNGMDDLSWALSNETPAAMESLLASVEAVCALKLTDGERAKATAAREAVAAFCALAPGQRTAQAACETLEQVSLPSLRGAVKKPVGEEARRLYHEAEVCAQYERVQGFVPQIVQVARKVHDRYAQLKLVRSYLDNDDLIELAMRAVTDHPEVARDYAGRFRLVMIDEFQDTDAKQLHLIGLLAGDGGRHLSTVGDAQQSIYRFRGGDVEVFRAHGRSLPPEAHVRMDVNYRSDPHVLACVERVCGDTGMLGDFLKLAGDGDRRSRLVATDAQGDQPPRVMLEVAMGGTADTLSATLAAQLANRLADYRAMGQPLGSMALLLGRTSRVDLYLNALRSRGLDAVVTGGSSFSSAPEVSVIQALLHTLSNPGNTQEGLFKLLSSEMFCLDADDFCQLGTKRQDKFDAPTKRPIQAPFLDEALELYGDASPSPRLRSAFEVLRRAFGRMGRWQLADVCQAVVDESGWLERLEGAGPDGLARAANVLAAVRYVRELTEDLGLGVAQAATEFDHWLRATKVTPKNLSGDEVDAVRVMTVHGSKGLQFGVCAVAECWEDAKVRGHLLVGRADGQHRVCLAPKNKPKDFSKALGSVEVPASAEECSSSAEWAAYLKLQELEAQDAEKARLLYVALTRAEESLVIGLPIPEKEQYRSALALQTCAAFLDPKSLVPGEGLISVEPLRPVEVESRGQNGTSRRPAALGAGVARVVCLTRPEQKDGLWTASSKGTMAGFDGELPESVTAWTAWGTSGTEQVEAARPFALYDVGCDEPEARGWRPRDDVFSYSAIHVLIEDEAPATRPPAPPRAQQDAEAEGSAYVSDEDKATNLGSAFHELAQTMVETRSDHDPARLEALARTWNLSERQRERLREATERWERSPLRREVWEWPLVRAEVPFFAPSGGSPHGDFVEGAIDLLCTKGTACEGEALVVDYKTGDRGLDEEAVHARHAAQAELYASVLLSLGFSHVECAFVAVETGVVARYSFED